jgi:hypothetical protein
MSGLDPDPVGPAAHFGGYGSASMACQSGNVFISAKCKVICYNFFQKISIGCLNIENFSTYDADETDNVSLPCSEKFFSPIMSYHTYPDPDSSSSSKNSKKNPDSYCAADFSLLNLPKGKKSRP